MNQLCFQLSKAATLSWEVRRWQLVTTPCSIFLPWCRCLSARRPSFVWHKCREMRLRATKRGAASSRICLQACSQLTKRIWAETLMKSEAHQETTRLFLSEKRVRTNSLPWNAINRFVRVTKVVRSWDPRFQIDPRWWVSSISKTTRLCINSLPQQLLRRANKNATSENYLQSYFI